MPPKSQMRPKMLKNAENQKMLENKVIIVF
jgi:hypothetical protein